MLCAECAKLLLSVLLATYQVYCERRQLCAPRHNLPSPELYSTLAHHDQATYLDPYDSNPQLPTPTLTPTRPHVRHSSLSLAHTRPHQRKRSDHVSSHPARTPDFTTLNVEFAHSGQAHAAAAPALPARPPEKVTLASYQWPQADQPSPRAYDDDKTKTPVLAQFYDSDDSFNPPQPSPTPSPEIVRALSDPGLWTRRRRLGLAHMLYEDIFGGDWWKMGIPAVLFALQNNLMSVPARVRDRRLGLSTSLTE